MTKPKAIAIIGGGITGATAAQTLSKYDNLIIHVFDQGRRGVGGRTSSRSAVPASCSGTTSMRWDHGCQFFRADTPQFQQILAEWMACGFVKEWKGRFISSSTLLRDKDFFGLPSTPPFYVGRDGMQSIANDVLEDAQQKLSRSSSSTSMSQFTGTRVAQMERDETTNRWVLYGCIGKNAYHDTPEADVKQNDCNYQIGKHDGYDAVILTDVSSSFGKWHRASAGVPEGFAKRVRERVGARVPLFTAMVAFNKTSSIPFDAASFDDEIIWFAAKSNSKPAMEAGRECWYVHKYKNCC